MFSHNDRRHPIFGTTRIHFSIYVVPTVKAIQNFYTGAQRIDISFIKNTMWDFYLYLNVKGQSRVHKTAHQRLENFKCWPILATSVAPPSDIHQQFAYCYRRCIFLLKLNTASKSTNKLRQYSLYSEPVQQTSRTKHLCATSVPPNFFRSDQCFRCYGVAKMYGICPIAVIDYYFFIIIKCAKFWTLIQNGAGGCKLWKFIDSCCFGGWGGANYQIWLYQRKIWQNEGTCQILH